MNKKTAECGTDPVDFKNLTGENNSARNSVNEENANDECCISCDTVNGEFNNNKISASPEKVSETEHNSSALPSLVDNMRFLNTIIPDR